MNYKSKIKSEEKAKKNVLKFKLRISLVAFTTLELATGIKKQHYCIHGSRDKLVLGSPAAAGRIDQCSKEHTSVIHWRRLYLAQRFILFGQYSVDQFMFLKTFDTCLRAKSK